ncbi:butyrophilin subfamily 1 member A1-like [Trichechus inunguis]
MAQLCLVAGTLLILFMVSKSGSGQFYVTGPKSPVTALVGEEAVFSCHLSPPMDAQNMEVNWCRDHPWGLVYHYGTSQDHVKQQRPEYQGRTEFLKENITKGQVALRIQHICPSDEGKYSCFFLSSTYYHEAQFQVVVTGSGTVPHIHIENGETKGIKLTCTSTGWYPEPEVRWRDLQGQYLAPTSETKIAEENGLFHVKTSVTVDESSKGNVSCFIRNPLLSVEKEAHISVSDALFPRHNPWIVVLAVIVSLLIIVIMAFIVLLVRCKKAKDEISKDLGLNKARSFAEDVILDRATSHPYLLVSDDGKSVTAVPEKQVLPDNPERFDTMVAVLGQNTFSGGNHYWEVGVATNSMWTIGLCLASVNRKGPFISACPESGFWTLCLRNGVYKALSTPRHILDVREPIFSVGIFLQYEEGLISFYNVTKSDNIPLLYTFKVKSPKDLRPYFYPGHLSQENNKGLTILKVSATGRT